MLHRTTVGHAALLCLALAGLCSHPRPAHAQPQFPVPPDVPPRTLHLAAVTAAGAPAIVANDNRRPAGRLRDGVLTVVLEARPGVWRPEGADGPSIAVLAFGEPGAAPTTPGPLLRVPQGTEVRATVRNRAAAPITLYGLGAAQGADSGAVIAAGAEHEFRFRADAAGLASYVGRLGARPPGPSFLRLHDDAQLHGVLVVDPPGTRPADRLFVISAWAAIDGTTPSGLGPGASLAINGRSWPHTERLTMRQADTARWRFVNASLLEHPIHLHGAYFRVDARGDGVRDTLYAPDARREVVTELMLPGTTMSMAWRPVHAGNWILHCHLASHITPRDVVESDRRMPARLAGAAPLARPVSDAHAGHGAAGGGMRHMEGLVLGVTVTPSGPAPVARGPERALRLVARSRDRVYGEYPGYAYVLGGSAEEALDTLPVPGPRLELVRGERVAVTLVNRMHEAMAVHWHGIELESFPDGVPGWSGAGRTTLPMIAPGDSLVVRFAPPRAGTFMYHSHSNEMQQIASGLYGTIVVREPGAPRDTTADRVLVFADGGPTINFFVPPPPVLVNGHADPAPMTVPAGRTVRLRMVNIRSELLTRVALLADSVPVRWRVVAKDGMPVAASRQRDVPASLVFSPGEIYDVEVQVPADRPLTLRWLSDNLPPPLQAPHTMVLRGG